MRYSYGFIRDYMSAKGISLERHGKGFRLGNPLLKTNPWLYFGTFEEVVDHVTKYY